MPVAIPALITLVQALAPLMALLPQYIRNRQKNNELEQFRLVLRYLEDVAVNADARNAVMTAQQDQIIQVLIAIVQGRTQQLEALRTPSVPMLPQQTPAQQIQQQRSIEQQIQQVVVDARKDLEPQLPAAAKLVPQEEALDVLTRLVGWQMTSTTLQTWNDNNKIDGGWSILGYYAVRTLYFIAVSGSDPSSARILSYQCACDRNPKVEWQMALATGVQNFANFESLPGTGIYDLATRLHEKYPEAKRGN